MATISVVLTRPSGCTSAATISTVSEDFYKLVVSGGRVYHMPTGIHFASATPLHISPFMLALAERLSQRIELVAETSASALSTAQSVASVLECSDRGCCKDHRRCRHDSSSDSDEAGASPSSKGRSPKTPRG